MRRPRVQIGEPIEASSVLDGVLPPSLGQTLGELEAMAQIGATLHELSERRRAERQGVIDLQEVAPGVFAMPKTARAPNPSRVGRFRALVADFNHLQRALHGNRRDR